MRRTELELVLLSLALPAAASAESYVQTASLSGTTASHGSPVLASVDFGGTFITVEYVCFHFTFRDDFLDPGEILVIVPRTAVPQTGPGIGNPGPGPIVSRTTCSPYGSMTLLFLDGREDLELGMYPGSVTFAELRVEIIGVKRPPPVPPVVMEFRLTPRTLNPQSQGPWVTGYFEPPPPLLPADIVIESVRLNSYVAADLSGTSEIGDHDADGFPDLTLRFPRAELQSLLPAGDNVPVHATGSIGAQGFVGDDSIRVRGGRVIRPSGMSRLELAPVRPSPSVSQARLRFVLPRAGSLDLSLHDVQGRRLATLATGDHEAGAHEFVWNGQTDSGGRAVGGVYFACLRADGQTLNRRIVWIP